MHIQLPCTFHSTFRLAGRGLGVAWAWPGQTFGRVAGTITDLYCCVMQYYSALNVIVNC